MIYGSFVKLFKITMRKESTVFLKQNIFSFNIKHTFLPYGHNECTLELVDQYCAYFGRSL